jgi:hypothetical protein
VKGAEAVNHTSSSNDAPPSEREKFERETKIKEDQVLLQREELSVKREESKKTFFSNPLALAVIGATIAAMMNVWVALHNGSQQRAVEKPKLIMTGGLNARKPRTRGL